MDTMQYRKLPALIAVAAAGCVLAGPGSAFAKKSEKKVTTWRVPIVMEQATVRGKIAILETRTEDRKTVKEIAVQIWSTEEQTKRRKTKIVRKELLHETATDEDGFFDLPQVKPDEYLLVIEPLAKPPATLRLTACVAGRFVS